MLSNLQRPTLASAKKTLKPTFNAILMIAIALVSALVLSPIFSSPSTYEGAYAKLEEKRNNVIALTTAATVTSFAITAVGPDDSGTPIADQLMAIAKDFAFVLAAIVLEKYLMTLMGTACFTGVIPLCCLIFAVTGFLDAENAKRQSLRSGATKLMVLGIVLFLTIPISVSIAALIDETYQESINAVNTRANEISGMAKEANEEGRADDSKSNSSSKQEDANFLDTIGKWGSGVVNTISTTVTSAADLVMNVINGARDLVGDLIELFGVMIATSILIPLLVPLVMYLALNMFFGQQIAMAPQQILVTTDSATAQLAPATQPLALEAGQTPSDEDTAAAGE